MAFVYLLKSKKTNRFYIGSTKNLERRIKEHLLGRVSATKYIRPLDLVFAQKFESLAKARKVEYRLKKLKRRDILEQIIKDGEIKLNV